MQFPLHRSFDTSINPCPHLVRSQGGRPRILVLDDERAIVELLGFLLEENFETTLCTDAVTAITLIETKEFDLVLTDLRMPGCSGVEVVRRARVTQPRTPVVVLTGCTEADAELQQVMDLGIQGVIHKPFRASAEQLNDTLMSYLVPEHRKHSQKESISDFNTARSCLF